MYVNFSLQELNKTFERMYEKFQAELQEMLVAFTGLNMADVDMGEIKEYITNVVMKHKDMLALDMQVVLEKSKISVQLALDKVLTKKRYKK